MIPNPLLSTSSNPKFFSFIPSTSTTSNPPSPPHLTLPLYTFDRCHT
uniref:Uncharacterized protein n=1 Tax=Arundo donax TaxID=35708 RepID=A0A0A8YFC1_ARUDO